MESHHFTDKKRKKKANLHGTLRNTCCFPEIKISTDLPPSNILIFCVFPPLEPFSQRCVKFTVRRSGQLMTSRQMCGGQLMETEKQFSTPQVIENTRQY